MKLFCEGIMFTIQTLLVFLGQYKKKLKSNISFDLLTLIFCDDCLYYLGRQREREELSDLQSDR